MRIVERLHAACAERAGSVRVSELTIGLGYTAVTTDDGGIGLAYTWLEDKSCCSFLRGWDNAEGAPAAELLDRLLGETGLERSVGMAAANALNHAAALKLPQDEGPAGALVSGLGIRSGTRVAMVGYFPPVAKALEGLGAELEIVDDALGMGDQVRLRERLGGWAETLIMSSTTLLGDTAEDLLAHAAPHVRVALLGPTTPLLPEAFEGLPVVVLAGMVPVDVAAVLRGVRHGAGTPELQRFSVKVYCVRGAVASSERA
jgi:uncharacterized protein (DUF4213/DUF364 family)